MIITQKQAQILQVKSHTQLSPFLEKCCLSLSANVSYERAAEDLHILTGINVSHSTQQRLVQRYDFEQTTVNETVTEMSLDGGKVRLRTPLGEPCCFRDYKAIDLHGQAVGAFFVDNEALINWVNIQPLETVISCLGDGHDGIWNIFAQIGDESQRVEVLDWYHLMENLHNVGGSIKRLNRVEALLWHGNIDGAIAEFADCQTQLAVNFVAYLEKHRHRIHNYEYLQMEGLSIGSGSVESTIKQIGRRVKISGAQWKSDNVPQLLKHRCAYLNGVFTTAQPSKACSKY